MVTDWHTFDFEKRLLDLGTVPMGNKRRKKDKRYTMNVYCAFDIETSIIWLNPDPKEYDVHAFMYSWAFQMEDYTFLGRYWEDFFSLLARIKSALTIVKEERFCETEPKLVIWIHNAAYEFSFLSGLYSFTDEECFFRDVRKPIYFSMFDVFEFRCSYIQTNLSLKMLCKQMGVPEKLSGQKFDYSKLRFPWTELSEYEQQYIITDVESLVMAMKKRVQQNGDNLVTVPLTSTGYVRRECKEALKGRYYDIAEMKPDEREYKLLRRAFRGGNTHANMMYSSKIINDVTSYDIVSCYPTQQLTQRFPMKPFRWLDCRLTLDRVFKFIGLGYAVVGLYQFKGLRLKHKKTPIPYLSLSRTESLMYKEEEIKDKNGTPVIDKKTGMPKTKKVECVKLDNGRILESYYTEVALTEIDLEIVLQQYIYDEINIVECMVAQKDFLPEEYRAVIQEYYNNKTALKGDDSEQGLYLYIKSKNMLNAVYGMSATDPIHQEILYKSGNYQRSSYETMTKEDKVKALKQAPFPYQWGVYTTALARAQLQRAIDLCGQQIIYCDTDSVKVKGKVPIEKLNDVQLKKAINAKAYADDKNGKRHYIGLFEEDAHYEKFITQGAKRYAYIKPGCKYKDCPDYNLCHMGVTVSGVTKQKNEETGRAFAVEELGSLENFHPGMVWVKAGGTMAVYNDHDDFDYMDPETGNTIHIGKNVAIIPSTYEMTYSKDYKLLLGEIQLYGEYKSERE